MQRNVISSEMMTNLVGLFQRGEFLELNKQLSKNGTAIAST